MAIEFDQIEASFRQLRDFVLNEDGAATARPGGGGGTTAGHRAERIGAELKVPTSSQTTSPVLFRR